MGIKQEFSRHADEYGNYNQIQKKVAEQLCSMLPFKPKKILDLGCGSGTAYNYIDWQIEKFIGVDFSLNMLKKHPKATNVELICGDFNDTNLFEELAKQDIDCILSSSALQWADDLDAIFKNLSSFDVPVHLAIFTSNTFRTLNQTAQLRSLIPSKEAILTSAEKYFHIKYEIAEYSLKFHSVREIFQYIKKSGVSGGRRALDLKQTKRLMREYPLDYLEFEVLFVSSFSKA